MFSSVGIGIIKLVTLDNKLQLLNNNNNCDSDDNNNRC